MKRQRNTAQMKEQDRNTQDQINEEEIGKPSEREFRVMIIKMIQNLKIEWTKCKEEIKNKQRPTIHNKI